MRGVRSRAKRERVACHLEQIIQIIATDATTRQLAVFLEILLDQFAFTFCKHRVFFEYEERRLSGAIQFFTEALMQIRAAGYCEHFLLSIQKLEHALDRRHSRHRLGVERLP